MNDIARAKKSGSTCGDPIIAPAGMSYYAEGQVIDYDCLVCGMPFAAHDGDSTCWRVITPKWKLMIYDICSRICEGIKA